jgi:alkylation response protein AidB-like acyl-CoA dehydrogenase
MVRDVARRLDAGLSVGAYIAAAKVFATEVAVEIAGEAVQLHGGYGYLDDFPVERILRDAKLCTIGEGTSEIQRLVLSRQLLSSP